MCGRFALTFKDVEAIIEELGIDSWDDMNEFSPSYNIAPSHVSPILYQDGIKMVKSMTWGVNSDYIYQYTTAHTHSHQIINIRSDTLVDKDDFEHWSNTHRCIVIASGYYEWEKRGKLKIPHYFYPSSQGVMLLAGLWFHDDSDTEGSGLYYAIVTTAAPEQIKHIHHRMPVILPNRAMSLWLSTEDIRQDAIGSLLANEELDLTSHTVPQLVNSPTNNYPDCIREQNYPEQPDLL